MSASLETNDWDLLLFWLSSWAKPPRREALVSACRALVDHRGSGVASSASPTATGGWHPLLEPLYRLGHIERCGGERYRAVPPTLLLYPNAGLFYGARSPGLWRRLEDRFGQRLGCLRAAGGPACWRIDTAGLDLVAGAHELGIRCQPERGTELLVGLPTLEQGVRELVRRRGVRLGQDEPLIGWERFEPPRGRGRTCWQKASREPEPGLYRPAERRGQMWLTILPRPGRAGRNGLLSRLELRTFEERGLFLWHELCRVRAARLFYRPDELWVHDISRLPLPLLVDRGLRLASGLHPGAVEYRGMPFRRYSCVDWRRARQVSRILGRRLEVIS